MYVKHFLSLKWRTGGIYDWICFWDWCPTCLCSQVSAEGEAAHLAVHSSAALTNQEDSFRGLPKSSSYAHFSLFIFLIHFNDLTVIYHHIICFSDDKSLIRVCLCLSALAAGLLSNVSPSPLEVKVEPADGEEFRLHQSHTRLHHPPHSSCLSHLSSDGLHSDADSDSREAEASSADPTNRWCPPVTAIFISSSDL